MLWIPLPIDAKDIKHRNPHHRRKKSPAFWLLAGPLIIGIFTHSFDLLLLRRYVGTDDSESIYVAEVAPHLMRAKKTVHLDGHSSWDSDTDDEVDKIDLESYYLQHREHDIDRYVDRHTSPDDGDCIAMHPWQEASFPVCNSIHEMDFFTKWRPDGDVSHITHGGFNDLYEYTERFLNDTRDEATSHSLALKILKWEKPYSELKFSVVRQDAITLERLTKSSYIYPIYGYCGFALVVPFMTGGRLADKLSEWRHGTIELSPMTRLQYAVDIAIGLKELHDIDGDGIASATHGDLKEQQYLFADDGKLQLGDFNKGQFITKSSSSGKPCTYKPVSRGYNDKVFRSPEEYAHLEQTAVTDVYALGSLMYYILTGESVWKGYHDSKGKKKAQKWIVDGKKPHISSKLLKSRDPVDQVLIEAYNMCTVYDPKKRATAKQVVEYLETAMKELS